MWEEQKQQANGSNSLREVEYLWDIVKLQPRKALSKTYQAYHKFLSQKNEPSSAYLYLHLILNEW